MGIIWEQLRVDLNICALLIQSTLYFLTSCHLMFGVLTRTLSPTSQAFFLPPTSVQALSFTLSKQDYGHVCVCPHVLTQPLEWKSLIACQTHQHVVHN